jgi:glycosyltransferase involved in cell wall biosynthesis
MTSYGKDDPLSIKNKNFILWEIFKLCDIYIGISPAFIKSFNLTDLPKKKYRFIPNGVDLNKYFPISNSEKKLLRYKYGYQHYDKIIIFVGHFSYEKRPKLIYDAWVQMHEKNKNIKLILIGKTKDFFEVDEKIKESIIIDAQLRGIMQHISFVEETSHVDEYMKISDVFALMSIREGMPNVLIEAMACGLPSVVNEILDVTDWLVKDGETGLLFSSKDPKILVEKILYFLTDNKNSHKIKIQSKQFVKNNFSSEEISLKILNLYKNLIGKI